MVAAPIDQASRSPRPMRSLRAVSRPRRAIQDLRPSASRSVEEPARDLTVERNDELRKEVIERLRDRDELGVRLLDAIQLVEQVHHDLRMRGRIEPSQLDAAGILQCVQESW